MNSTCMVFLVRLLFNFIYKEVPHFHLGVLLFRVNFRTKFSKSFWEDYCF